MNRSIVRPARIALLLAVVVATAVVAEEGTVKGWFKAGNDPDGYVIGTEKIEESSVAYIRSGMPADGKFGTLMQSFSPGEYMGKRVRMSARVKADGVEGWAGMWMRVDDDQTAVSFDNMMDRAIKGTVDWKRYSIVLDVPEGSDLVSIGILLSGPGEVYWDDVKLEVVGEDVALTGQSTASRPRSKPENLDFEG